MDKKKTGGIPERADVDSEFKWHPGDIFPTDESWEDALKEAEKEIQRITSFKGKLGESAETLLGCFTFRDEISVKIEQLYAYAAIKKDEDTRVTNYLEMHDRISTLCVRFSALASYITPEIMSIPEETIRSFVDEEDGLKTYRHAIEDLLRLRRHILSEKEEALIAKAGNVFRAPSDVFNLLTNADMIFPGIKDEEGGDIEISNSLYYLHRGSADRSVRKANEEAFHGTYRRYRNSLAALLRAGVQKSLFNAEVRGYESTLHAELDEDRIPLDVFHGLLNTVNDNLAPLHRYTSLRKRILGLDEVRGYDLYNSLFPGAKMTVPFGEAKEMLIRGMKPLGGEYTRNLAAGMEGGWTDVYENAGKRSGAYSLGLYGVHPYVLLNHHDRLDDAFTLAHEFGHAMHSYYSQMAQPRVYSDYTIFNAEIASTTNETLFMNHLLAETNDREKRLYLLDFYIDSIRSTFYRQTLFSEFELDIHKRAGNGEALSAELMDGIYGRLFEKYYGPEFVLDEYKSAEWSRIPHFYRPFYVFSYATGLSAAVLFANKILDEGEGAARRYIDCFLSAGSSDYSTEILAKAGVDVTSPEAVLATTRLFNRLLDEVEEML